jgi:hypothetical protein
VLAALAADAPDAAAQVHKIGVDDVPQSGENNETLARHGLDGNGIAARVRSALATRV